MFEEAHLAVDKTAVGCLCSVALVLPDAFAFPEDVFGGVEDVFDGGKPVGAEVAADVALVGFGVVVTVEVEDPEGIQMGVHSHVQSV